MIKKLVMGGLISVFLILGMSVAFAAVEYKSNVYQVGTFLNSTYTSRGFTFPIPCRDLIISNAASSASIIVCLDSASATSYTIGTEGGVFLGAGEMLPLRNYITEGISIIRYNNRDASDISIIATY